VPADEAEPAAGVGRDALHDEDEDEDVRGVVLHTCMAVVDVDVRTYYARSLRAPVCVFGHVRFGGVLNNPVILAYVRTRCLTTRRPWLAQHADVILA
jgi:hypothetical protein